MKVRARLSVAVGVICSTLVIASAALAAASTQITLNKRLDNPPRQDLQLQQELPRQSQGHCLHAEGLDSEPRGRPEDADDHLVALTRCIIRHLGHGQSWLPAA